MPEIHGSAGLRTPSQQVLGTLLGPSKWALLTFALTTALCWGLDRALGCVFTT